MDMLQFAISRDPWLQFPCGFGKKGVVERAMNLKNRKARTKASLWVAGAVVAAAAIILIPNAQSISRGGGAQELAVRESRDGLPGIGALLQAVGAGKAKSSQEAFQGEGSGDVQGGNEGVVSVGIQEEAEKPQEVHAAQSQEKPQDFQGSLERYFTELYSVLSDDAKNFSSGDFASTDGYMVGKHLMERRYLGNALYGGIDNVRLQKVEIQSMEEADDRVEAMASAEILFDYGIYSGLPGDAKSERDYDLYKVSAIREENGYRILDISSDAEWHRRAKEALAAENTPDIESNYAAVDAYFEKMQAYQESLEKYFMELFSALADDTKNFSYDDFASTNGYIMGRQIMAERYGANVSYGGYAAVKIEEVDIESISETEDGIEVMAHVIYTSSYGMSPNSFSGTGDTFRISAIPEKDGYKVLDIDFNSEVKWLVDDYLEAENVPNPESNYAAIDAYFERIEKNSDETQKEIEKKGTEKK